jgi:2-amino-4-hydroxy-6-hydroxymethyldihydropteridine diphosphokinase
MEQHICIISIGSNMDKECNMKLAQEQLSVYFPEILFGTERETIPVGMNNPAHFTNQIAKASTNLSIQEVKHILKQIEVQAGRCPEDKKAEVIKLDIDLLMYDSLVLKEKDLKRDFVIAGLKELGI